MENIRLARPSDREAWNRVALSSPHSTYAHTWEWKLTLELGLGVESICLVAEVDGQVVGVYSAFLYPKYKSNESFAFIKTTLLAKARVLWSPLFMTWDYGGPCFLPGVSQDLTVALIREMEKLGAQRNAFDLWISPYQDTGLQETLLKCGYSVRSRLTSQVDLSPSEEEILKRLKGETRSQVRQGLKFGLEVVERTDPSGLQEFYKCLQSVAERTEMALPPWSLFEALLANFDPVKMLRIYHVRHEGKIIGAALFIYYKQVTVARYWAAFRETLSLRPYHAMIWHIMIEAKKLGCNTCDFGGMPPDENDGIYKFKKGWGGSVDHVDWFVKPLKLVGARTVAKRVGELVRKKRGGK